MKKTVLHDENEEQLVEIRVPVKADFVKSRPWLKLEHGYVFGVKQDFIRQLVTKEVAETYNADYEREKKADQRRNKCRLTDADGNTHRCSKPSCWKCTYDLQTKYKLRNEELNRGSEGGEDGHEISNDYSDPFDLEEYVLGSISAEAIRQDIQVEFGEKYVKAVQLLQHGYSRSEVCEILEIKKTTFNDHLRLIKDCLVQKGYTI